MYRALPVTAAPDTLHGMFRARSAVSGRLTRATAAGAAAVELPRVRLAAVQRLFPYRAAAIWNSMSDDVTGSASQDRLLKQFGH